MKKTLIALAAMATAQLVMAQVTVTGKLGFGFAKTQPISKPADPGAIGMQTTDGELNFQAVEDLGGGYKVTINSAVSLKGRDSQVYAKDATIAFLTPIGQLTMGSVDNDSQYPRSFAGAKISLPSDKQVAGGDHADVIAFTTKLGPIFTTLAYSEVGSQDICDLAIGLGDASNACNPNIKPVGKYPLSPTLSIPFLNGGTAANLAPGGPGPGKGAAQASSLTGSYNEGPLSLGLTVVSYFVADGVATDKAGIALFKSAYDGRVDTNVSAAYDFGVLKLGLGYNKRGKGWGDETFAGISVPVGAFSFGVTYEQKADDTKSLGDGVTAGPSASGALIALAKGDLSKLPQANLGDFFPTLIAGDLKGTAKRTKVRVGVDYAFSKLTSLNLSYGAYEYGNAERAFTALPDGKGGYIPQPSNVKTDEYQLRLLKQF